MNISNREKWEQLLPVFSELSSLVSALCDLEDSLTVSASKNDLEELTRLVSEAQPTLLRFRGLEQKRVKLQKECGFAPRSMAEFLTGIPEELREDWENPIADLQNNLRRFIHSRENADRILQVRISDISQQLQGQPEVSFRDRRV